MSIKKLLASGFFGGGASYSPELQAVIDLADLEALTKPQPEVLRVYDEYLIKPLVASEVIPWAGWETLNFQGIGSLDWGTINLIDPATYRHTYTIAPEFHEPADETDPFGIRSAANGFINTNYKVNQYAGIESDLTTIVDVSQAGTDNLNQLVYGARTLVSGATNSYSLTPKNAGNASVLRYATGSTFANTDHAGLYVITRVGGSLVAYKDGTKVLNGAKTFSAPDISNDILWLAMNASTTGTVSPAQYYTKYSRILARYRGSWTDAMELEFRTIYTTFLTQLIEAFFFSVGIGSMEIGSSFVIR